MPLYDPDNPLSVEVPAALALAGIISETAGAQKLLEANDAAAALKKIRVGGGWEEPWDGRKFERNQLESEHARIFVSPEPESSHEVAEDEASVSCPNETGRLMVLCQRQAREHELAAVNGRQDVFQFFWDCVSNIEKGIMRRTWEHRWTFRIVQREGAPGWEVPTTQTARGDMLMAVFYAQWGDVALNE